MTVKDLEPIWEDYCDELSDYDLEPYYSEEYGFSLNIEPLMYKDEDKPAMTRKQIKTTIMEFFEDLFNISEKEAKDLIKSIDVERVKSRYEEHYENWWFLNTSKDSLIELGYIEE